MSGLLSSNDVAFQTLASAQNYVSDFNEVFTEGYVHSIKFYNDRIGLVWGISLTCSACRVNGVRNWLLS